MTVVDGDEVVGADKEVHILCRELAFVVLERDPVQDGVQIPVVRLDLRVVQFRPRIFHRQRVERERVTEDEQFGNRRAAEVHPEEGVRRRIEPGAVDALDLLGLAVAIEVDGYQEKALDFRLWASALGWASDYT